MTTVVSIFVFMAVVSFVIAVAFSRRNKTMETAAAALNAQKVSGNTYKGMIDGIEYSYHYYPGSRNSSPSFTITLPCQSSGKFKILKETAFDRFFRKLGISSEVQTFDSAFDNRFYIETDHPSFMSSYLTHERREEITKIFDQEFTSLELRENKFVLIKTPFELSLLNDEFVKKAVQEMAVLSKHLPPEVPSEIPVGVSQQANYSVKSKSIASMIALALAAGLGLTFWSAFSFVPLDITKVVFFSLKLSIPAYIFLVIFSFTALKGHSRSHKDLLAVWLLGLAAAGVLGYGTTAFYNGYLDTSSTANHHALVNSKHFSRGKDSTTYYINVQSWREGRAAEKFRVPYSFYKHVTPKKSIVTVVTKPGKLGFEWKVSLTRQ